MRRTPILIATALAALAVASPVHARKGQFPIEPGPPPPVCGPQAADPRCPNPLAGQMWFVDRQWGAAWRQYRQLHRQGGHGSAGLVLRIARHPVFKRFGRWDAGPRAAASKYIARARAAMPGSVPLISVMRHEGEQCHSSYDGGGRRADAGYRSWLARFAQGVGHSRVVIAFEPDSLGTIECLSRKRRAARLRLLAWGVDLLSKLPNATVYVEGGACDWQPANRIARKLRRLGIHKVRGFMLNATHFAGTKCNVRYGARISRLTGGKHFIVNTSENGNGGRYYWTRVAGRRKRVTVWCNPPGTKLGPRPTAYTGHRLADGYLWIGRPGYSAGRCNGGPSTGKWWPERALAIARRSGF